MKFSIAALLVSAALFAIFVYPAESRSRVLADLQRYAGLRSLALGLGAGVAILVAGAAYGAALESLGITPQRALSRQIADSVAQGAASAVLAFVAACAVAPAMEELVFRGTMLEFFIKAKAMPVSKAILVTSLLFALVHLDWATLPIAFAAGILLGALRVATASLQPCVLAHATANVGGMLAALADAAIRS